MWLLFPLFEKPPVFELWSLLGNSTPRISASIILPAYTLLFQLLMIWSKCHQVEKRNNSNEIKWACQIYLLCSLRNLQWGQQKNLLLWNNHRTIFSMFFFAFRNLYFDFSFQNSSLVSLVTQSLQKPLWCLILDSTCYLIQGASTFYSY